MHECPEELRKSALFILNANGASLLLVASFGGQGSSKQKGTEESRPVLGAARWADSFGHGCSGPREVPCTQRAVSPRVGAFKAPGHRVAQRGYIPEGAQSGSRAKVPVHSLEKLCSWKRSLPGREDSSCPKFRLIAPPLSGVGTAQRLGTCPPRGGNPTLKLTKRPLVSAGSKSRVSLISCRSRTPSLLLERKGL